MLKTETRIIEGLSVTVTQLPVLTAYAVFARLGKVLGPAIGKLAGFSMTDVGSLDVSELTPALSELLGGLCEEESLVPLLLSSSYVVVDGSKIELTDPMKINHAYAGKFKAMLLSLKFSIEVNFGDFLSGESLKAAVKTGQDAASLVTAEKL